MIRRKGWFTIIHFVRIEYILSVQNTTSRREYLIQISNDGFYVSVTNTLRCSTVTPDCVLTR